MSLEAIRARLATMSAAQAAELFLSPFVDRRLLVEATQDEGPALWIVNRSDVYDATLQGLSAHSIEGIASRAREKLATRHTSLVLLSPPEIDTPLHEITDQSIEDVIGHPLVPLEAVLFFARHLSDDVRASSALSLTRRLLEHPPNWDAGPGMKSSLIDAFGSMLLGDPSPFVRAYCARVPLLPESLFEEAIRREEHPLVAARLLQNPATNLKTLELAADFDDEAVQSVLALDARLPHDLRRQLSNGQDKLSAHIQEWYLLSN